MPTEDQTLWLVVLNPSDPSTIFICHIAFRCTLNCLFLYNACSYERHVTSLVYKFLLFSPLLILSSSFTTFCSSCLSHSPDPRVSDWPLMQSPFPSYTLCFGYATMCVIGPYIMMKREPFRIRPLLIVYNIALVFLSLYMCSEVHMFLAF